MKEEEKVVRCFYNILHLFCFFWMYRLVDMVLIFLFLCYLYWSATLDSNTSSQLVLVKRWKEGLKQVIFGGGLSGNSHASHN